MPNVFIDKAIDRATQVGLDWDTAKWRIYCIKEAPFGDMQRLTNFLASVNSTTTGNAVMQYKTMAANDLNKGTSADKIILTKMKSSGNRVYNPGSSYIVGDIVHPNTLLGRPVNNYLHRCIWAGSHNSTPLWASQVGGYAATLNSTGPVFQNTGYKINEWPQMGGYYLGTYTMPTGFTYADPTNVAFAISGWNLAGSTNRYPGVVRDINVTNDYGIIYPIRTYLDQWTPEASILSMSAPLTNRVIRANGVLDCNDTEISTGTTNSANVFLLLVRVAHNEADTDLPLAEQQPIAFWDYARNIGSVFGPDNFTGTALLSMSNMLQLATPVSATEAGLEVGE